MFIRWCSLNERSKLISVSFVRKFPAIGSFIQTQYKALSFSFISANRTNNEYRKSARRDFVWPRRIFVSFSLSEYRISLKQVWHRARLCRHAPLMLTIELLCRPNYRVLQKSSPRVHRNLDCKEHQPSQTTSADYRTSTRCISNLRVGFSTRAHKPRNPLGTLFFVSFLLLEYRISLKQVWHHALL